MSEREGHESFLVFDCVLELGGRSLAQVEVERADPVLKRGGLGVGVGMGGSDGCWSGAVEGVGGMERRDSDGAVGCGGDEAAAGEEAEGQSGEDDGVPPSIFSNQREDQGSGEQAEQHGLPPRADIADQRGGGIYFAAS